MSHARDGAANGSAARGMSAHSLPDPVHEPAFYDGVPAKRLLAFVIDAVVILVVSVLTLPFTAFLGLFFFPFLMAAVGFAYRLLTLVLSSATWGMRLMSIELRERDGLRLTPMVAFGHVVGFYVSFAIFPLQVISVGMMAFLGRGQGLSDMILGTAMINRPV